MRNRTDRLRRAGPPADRREGREEGERARLSANALFSVQAIESIAFTDWKSLKILPRNLGFLPEYLVILPAGLENLPNNLDFLPRAGRACGWRPQGYLSATPVGTRSAAGAERLDAPPADPAVGGEFRRDPKPGRKPMKSLDADAKSALKRR